jgi:large subunit ribosomal protein L15
MLLLNELPKVVTKKRKRLGLGEGSGLGKNCGKGHKGQTKRGGKRPVYFTGNKSDAGMSAMGRVPKRKGFKARVNLQFVELTTDHLLSHFSKSETVSLQTLKEKSLVGVKTNKVKIIAGLKPFAKNQLIFDTNENFKLSKSIA